MFSLNTMSQLATDSSGHYFGTILFYLVYQRIEALLMSSNPIEGTGTRSRKGPRAPTFNLVLLLHVTMITKGSAYMDIMHR